mmetsp:Transcript_11063/g.15639  ORF Transcript_11063/g.15639 Transcript_11063/m.15639 type:complete len:107 (+) Transcript_11063:70-390(+)
MTSMPIARFACSVPCALLFFCATCAQIVVAEEVTTTVVVIGGGASGLAAAKALAEENVDFILLEARDVLGGSGVGWNVAVLLPARLKGDVDCFPLNLITELFCFRP